MSRAVSKPRFGLLIVVIGALLLAYVWRVQELFPILAKVQLPRVSLLAGLGLVVFGGHLTRLAVDGRHSTFRWMFAILGLVALSIPGSLYPGLSFGFMTRDFLMTILMAVLIAAAIRDFRDLEFVAGVLLGGAALYCWFIVTRFSVGSGGRLGNLVYYDANDLALWIVVTLPIAVYFLTKPGAKVWSRLLVAATAGLMMFALVKTGSRGGFLGLIAVGIYLLVGYRSIPVQKRVAAAGGLLLVMMAVAGEQYWEMMATLLDPTSDYNWDTSDPGGAGRRAVWNRGIGYMLDNPLTGVGAKAFAVAEGTIGPTAHLQAVGRGLKWSAAHNSFVQIGAELGVFGLLAFVAMLGTAYRSGRRISARLGADPRVQGLGQAFSGSVIGFAVSGALLSQAYGAYLYALMALVVALDRVSRRPAVGGDLVEPAPAGPRWRHNVVAQRRSLREPIHVRRARRAGPGAAEAG